MTDATTLRRRTMDGDVAPSGDLVQPGAYVVYAWRTNTGEEEATEIRSGTPEEAGEALASLLRAGHVHFTGNRLQADGRVAFPRLNDL